MGPACPVAPGTELRIEVVAGQTKQRRHIRLDAHQRLAVALRAGGQAATWIAHLHQQPAKLKGARIRRSRRGWRVRWVLSREMRRHLAQIIVSQSIDHPGHGGRGTPGIAEMRELVEEIACGLAGNARVVTIRACTALRPMASGAGFHAIGHQLSRCGRRRHARGRSRRRHGAGCALWVLNRLSRLTRMTRACALRLSHCGARDANKPAHQQCGSGPRCQPGHLIGKTMTGHEFSGGQGLKAAEV